MSSETKCIHFIGVGGVGMSGIARVASDSGMRVSGSDMKSSRYTEQLAQAGIPVFIGHDAGNLPSDCDVVVVSTAIPETNPELAAARERGTEVWQRARMLAELGRGKKTLAAAGTHGKTTTSSMLATATDALGLSPTFVVGGIVDAYQTNAVSGKGEYYVVEADESDGSFLNLSPYVALVTNIEADHLDHYVGGIEEIRETFARFMSSVPDQGAIVACGEDPALVELACSTGKRVVTYGFDASCDTRVLDYRTEGIATSFTLAFPDGLSVQCRLAKNPGRHNALNAAGVLSVIWALGEDVSRAAEGLAGYSGVRRRFDLVGEAAGVTVVDDYAHHPTEVAATIEAAKALSFDRVVVLFQPHRYTRTQTLAKEFAHAFDRADSLMIMDVYSAGEDPIEGVSGQTIVDRINALSDAGKATYLPSKDETVEVVLDAVRPGDLLITMGAGDVTSFGPLVVRALEQR